jgi:hypothetical protein
MICRGIHPAGRPIFRVEGVQVLTHLSKRRFSGIP